MTKSYAKSENHINLNHINMYILMYGYICAGVDQGLGPPPPFQKKKKNCVYLVLKVKFLV
jgi:hypothetical protein